MRHTTSKGIRECSQVVRQEKRIEDGRVDGSAMWAHNHLRKSSQRQVHHVCTIEWNAPFTRLSFPYLYAASVFCRSLSIIFRLAARIISSLLRFSASALSFLLTNHCLLPVVDADSLSVESVGVTILLDRLYRVIRSGLTGFAVCAGVVGDVAVAGRGI